MSDIKEKKPKKNVGRPREELIKQGFQKGNQLAKGRGRPGLTDEQRALRVTTRTQLTNIMADYLSLTLPEVSLKLEDPSLAVLDIAILKSIKKMHEDGSMERVDWIVDHVMGKRAAKVEVKNTTPGGDLSNLSEDQLEQLKQIALAAKANNEDQ